MFEKYRLMAVLEAPFQVFRNSLATIRGSPYEVHRERAQGVLVEIGQEVIRFLEKVGADDLVRIAPCQNGTRERPLAYITGEVRDASYDGGQLCVQVRNPGRVEEWKEERRSLEHILQIQVWRVKEQRA